MKLALVLAILLIVAVGMEASTVRPIGCESCECDCTILEGIVDGRWHPPVPVHNGPGDTYFINKYGQWE